MQHFKINFIKMNYFLTPVLAFMLFKATPTQDTTKNITVRKLETAKKADNYTIQRLIVFNNTRQILLEKNKNGWMTPALRSNENQSLKEGLDSLAHAMGISIKIIKLAGVFTYKFKGVPDHKEVSYRTHYTANFINGNLIQPKQSDKEYKWLNAKEALELIGNEALKAETSQIINHPDTLWGGSFLISYNGDELESIKMTEGFYSLSGN